MYVRCLAPPRTHPGGTRTFTTVRGGKRLTFRKHALEGMGCERPPVFVHELLDVLEEPDHDDGSQALRWMGDRTILLYYETLEDEVLVRSVSATKRRLAPPLQRP